MAERPFLGILGGTFDPVHHGHLRLAIEVVERLGLERLHLVPSADPPHREKVFAPAALRLEMVQAAVAGIPELVADDRELRRPGPSFTVDTLQAFREAFPAASLVFILGADAFAGLPTWHAYTKLTDAAHLVVVNRPGTPVPEHPALAEFASPRWVDQVAILENEPCGGIYPLQMPVLDIASSDIRARCARGRSIDFLTPPDVVACIRRHGLYQSAPVAQGRAHDPTSTQGAGPV